MGHCYLPWGLLFSAVIITAPLQGTTGLPNVTSAGAEVQARSNQDVDPDTVSCISNWKQLLDLRLFCNERIGKTAMLILFHIRTVHSSDSTTCCTMNDSTDACVMMASFVTSLFGQYPPALLFILASAGMPLMFHRYGAYLQGTMKEICWELQTPFCNVEYKVDIIRDFIGNVLPSELTSENNAYATPWMFTPDKFHGISVTGALQVYSLLLFLSLTILMSVPWLIKRFGHNFHPEAQVAKALLFSAMFNSWMWFFFLYGCQFWALSGFKALLYSKSALMSFAYMPFVDMGYLTFAVMGGLFLVEFPFLVWYISTRVMLPKGGRCVPNTLKSIGFAGMVLFAQVLSSYCVYCLMICLVYPLLPLLFAFSAVVLLAILCACTALAILPCLTGCRQCPQKSCFIVFFLLLAVSCAEVLGIMGSAMNYNSKTMFNTNSIVSGLFVSCTFAALGFAFSSLLRQNNTAHRGGYLPIP